MVVRAATGKLTLAKGSSYDLGATTSAGAITRKSSKTKVVRVSTKGVLKAKKTGKATVTVTAKSGAKKATKKITVTVVAKSKYKKVKKIKVSVGSKTLAVGSSTKAKLTFTPKKASNRNAIFKSSDTSVATVSATGTIKAKNPGTATITATSCANRKATASVKVKVSAIARREAYALAGGGSASLAATAFNNGIAWALLDPVGGGAERLGLINTKGQVVSLVDEQLFDGWDADSIAATPFVNGLSALAPSGHFDQQDFAIVNASGEVIHRSLDGSTRLLGQAQDGRFLLARHVSGFSEESWYACVLNTDLTLTETKIKLPKEPSQLGGAVELADGVYYLSEDWTMVNLNTGTCYEVMDDPSIAELGDSHSLITWSGSAAPCLVPNSALRDVGSAEQLESLLESNKGYQRPFLDGISHSYSPEAWHGVSFLYYDAGFYAVAPVGYVDADGATIMSYPTFPGEVEYVTFNRFSGGYSAIYLQGADGKLYASIVDETGAMRYEPVVLDDDSGDARSVGSRARSCSGYIFVKDPDTELDWGLGAGSDLPMDIGVIDPSGKRTVLGADLSGLKSATYTFYGGVSSYAFNLAIGGGFVFCESGGRDRCYFSTDGKTTIRTVTASYDGKGNLVYG